MYRVIKTTLIIETVGMPVKPLSEHFRAQTDLRNSNRMELSTIGYIRTSGIFGHTFANSVNPDETAPYEPSHQDFRCLLS